MNEIELIELMKKRWTAHKFKSKDITEKDLDNILEAGRWAPSGGNKQPWELIVIRDNKIKNKIAEIYAEGMGSTKIAKRFIDPPVLIAVCVDTRIIDSYPDMMPREFVIYASIGTMVQNMSLMATLMGLSLSWGTQPIRIHNKLKKVLHIPEYIDIPDILQLGYPDQDKFLSKRRDKDQFIHKDIIDSTKLRNL